jgi:ABC-type nitrate/sulfonate/bicarbonate transport systems, periplasmic components
MFSMPLVPSLQISVLILCALACPRPAGAGTTLRVGSIPIVGNVALYCAMDYGGPAAEGIEIQSTDFQSGTRIVEALAGGSLDIGFSATLSVLQAVQQGLDLVIVAPASFKAADSRPSTSALVARKDAGITGPAQLRGKTVAVNSLRSLDYLIAAEYLSRGGLSSRDVTWQELSYPHMMPALDNARVDAAFVAEPFLSILHNGDRVTILSPALDIIPGSSTASYTALRSWSEGRPAVLEAFLRGLRRGIDACERDPQKMRDAVVKHTGIKPALARQIGLPVLRPTLRAADLLPLMELARRHGLLVRDVDIERLLAPGATR